ncbi:Rhodanese-like domain-containing protein [Tirmania nivea]|nr:Rhodanese-like domain-containing protein [Tirmania nivea]
MNFTILRCPLRIPLVHPYVAGRCIRRVPPSGQRQLSSTLRRPTSQPASDPPHDEATICGYPTIKALASGARPTDPPTILIDVREPAEYAAGHIPTAKNLPVMTKPDAFFLPRDEFRDVVGWDKPDGAPVVFYCKAGVRSAAAAGLARRAGWRAVREYPGSWVDWCEREKEGKGE